MKTYLFIFDMGGVVTHSFLVWDKICAAMGIQNAAQTDKRHWGLIESAMRGNISSLESLQLLARREGVADPKENYWLSFFNPTVDADTVALVRDLRARGERVVCGTNTIEVHYQYQLDNGEYACFDKVYASQLMRQIKPDITFWHYIKAAEKSYEFDDMFFFDDMPENVAAAASLGIHAHVYTSAEDARAYIESVIGERV